MTTYILILNLAALLLAISIRYLRRPGQLSVTYLHTLVLLLTDLLMKEWTTKVPSVRLIG
jgi:hypothetical protein